MKKIVLTFFTALLLLSGCASKGVIMKSEMAGENRIAMQQNQNSALADRLIIKTASLTVSADDPKTASAAAAQIAVSAGGFVQNESCYGEAYTLYLKVPSDKLEETLKNLSVLGDQEEMSISKTDVTAQVADNEAILKTKIALRDRFRQILNQAKDVKDIMAVESELARVQGEIDSMQAVLKTIKGQVEMSDISLRIEKKVMPGPLGWIFIGIGWIFKKLFVLSGM